MPQSKIRVKARPFVALDGEGTQSAYALLASSQERFIARKSGLTTEECFEYLLSLPRGSASGIRPIYVWFAFDYDVNMMLGDIPLRGENSIETLKETNKLQWRGYRITYIRRKILRIRRGSRIHSSVDIWGFFQSSFENACADWGIEVLPIIQEGKAARSGFDKWSIEKLRQYNSAELIALAELAEKLRTACAPLNLPIQSWHGPAALAGAWLQKNKIKRFIQNDTDNSTPDAFREIATRAYFGGRIDVQGFGIVDPVFHYDIISAYPAGIARLPDLSKIKWERRKGTPTEREIYVARIHWKIPATYWSPFPWRSRNGSIRYPLEGEGWYWNYEIESAIRKYGSEYFTIKEYWYANGEIEFPLWNLIHDAFAYRQKLKREGNQSNRAIRLILNSLYGKFAQTVGKASYNCPVWAGLITSYTRATLLDALTDSVVCTMTDSLWSREPLQLEIGTELGQWESQDEKRMWLAEAGLYEAESDSGERTVWQRGFDKRNPVDIQTLVSNWLSGNCESPSYDISRFIGYGLALQSPNYHWRTWQTLNRKIEPVPLVGTTKRLPCYPTDSKLPTDFVLLELRSRDTEEISYPYKKITEDLGLILQRLEDECEEE